LFEELRVRTPFRPQTNLAGEAAATNADGDTTLGAVVLRRRRWTRVNYRGATVEVQAGAMTVTVSSLAAPILESLLEGAALTSDSARILVAGRATAGQVEAVLAALLQSGIAVRV
jgi:hypothetical protein